MATTKKLLADLLPTTRWQRTLYIMFVAQIVSAVGFSVIFPFLPLYVQELGTRTDLSIEFWSGLVFSSQAITMMITAPIWGSLADRYGRKLMVERALFGGAIIIFLMAFPRTAEELVILRAIQGMITGVISAANALVASMAPRERMGYAMGLLQVGLWSGLAAGPLIGGAIADLFGFRATFMITAVLLLVAGVLVWLGIHEPPPAQHASTKRRPGVIESWRLVFSRPGVVVTYGLRFVCWLGQTMLVPILPLFVAALLHQSGRVSTFTGLVVGVSSAAGTISAIYLGRLGDRIGHRKIFIGTVLAAALFFAPQALVQEGWQLLALQALSGAAVGGTTPAVGALLARYTRPGEEGAVYGLESSIGSGARAIAPLLGAGVAVWFGLRGIFVVTGAIFLLAALLALWRLPEPAPAGERAQRA